MTDKELQQALEWFSSSQRPDALLEHFTQMPRTDEASWKYGETLAREVQRQAEAIEAASKLLVSVRPFVETGYQAAVNTSITPHDPHDMNRAQFIETMLRDTWGGALKDFDAALSKLSEVKK